MSLPVIKDSDPCSCSTCKSMCRRPCWPIPSDVRALIDAGEGKRLMLDHWIGDFSGDLRDNTYIVCPANPGYEGTSAPESDYMFSHFSSLLSGCVFNKDGLCELHERGLKPTEGRAAHHAIKQPELHENVARHWDTEEGRKVVALWCALVGVYNPIESI